MMGVLCKMKTYLCAECYELGWHDRVWFEWLCDSIYAWLRAAPQQDFEINAGNRLVSHSMIARCPDLTKRIEILPPNPAILDPDEPMPMLRPM